MRTILVVLLAVALVPLAPLASATISPPDPRPVCVFDPAIWDQNLGQACVDASISPLCVTVWATVYSQHVYADVTTPDASFTTKPVNVGPVHVSSVTVSVDSVHVLTVDQWTPQKGFTNTFCTTNVAA